MTEAWQDSLSEDIRANPTLGKFKDIDGMAKSYIEMERMSGRSLVQPGEDAPKESWDKYYEKALESGHLTVHPDHSGDEQSAAFWKAAGVPEDKGGYVVEDGFDGLPKEVLDIWSDIAAEAGMTKKQYQKSISKIAELKAAETERFDQMVADDAAIVSTAWGNAETQKKEGIHALVDQFQDPAHPVEMNAAGYLMMDNILKAFTGKGPQVRQQPAAGETQYTPGELDEMISNLTTQLTDEGRSMDKAKYNALQRKRMKYLEMKSAAS